MLCAASVLGISWQHLSHSNFICAVFISFIFIFIYDQYLGIPLLHEDDCTKLKIIALKVHKRVFAIMMVLMVLKDWRLVIGFIQKYNHFSVKTSATQRFYETILHNEQPLYLKVL